MEGQAGSGVCGGFVVLDRDLTAATPQDILKTQVLKTVVGGKTVYETGTQEEKQ